MACLRVTDLHPSIDPLTGAVRREAAGLGLSDADAAALEHALRAGERWGLPVAAVAAGGLAIDPVLREVAALGTSVLRVETGEEDGSVAEELVGDEHRIARSLSRAVRAAFGSPPLVVCGDRSADRGTGAVPAFLAHELRAAQALGLVDFRPLGAPPGGGDHRREEDGHRDGSSPREEEDTGPARIVAERRLDGGGRERLRVPLPAVCSVEAAGVRLRRAPLEGALSVAGTKVPHMRAPAEPATAATVRVGAMRPFAPRPRVVPGPDSDDARARVLALCGALESREPPVVIGPLPPSEAADELLDFLGRHGYLPAGDAGALPGGVADQGGPAPRPEQAAHP